MTETNIDQDRMRKLKALLAQAESEAELGNEEAAESFVAKAQELQSKWSISDAMLAATGDASRPQTIISKTMTLDGTNGRRRVGLAHVVALRTDCTGYFGHGHRTVTKTSADGERTFLGADYDSPKVYTYTVFGFEGDVAWAEELTHSLLRQMDSELKHAQRERRGWENGRSFAVSFIAGFTSSINNRLQTARRASEKAAQAEQGSVHEGGASVSLVLVEKAKQVRAEMTAKVGRLGKGSSLSTTSYSGYDAGKSAGNRATISRGSLGSGTRGSLGR